MTSLPAPLTGRRLSLDCMLVTMMLCVLALALTGSEPHAKIFNQDGMGFSGFWDNCVADSAASNAFEMTLLNATWPTDLVLGNGAFVGGVFDSSHVWLAPYRANGVVRIDAATLTMTLLKEWPAGLSPGSFEGAVFASTHVWLVPHGANGIVRIDVATLNMTLLNSWPAGFVFSDGAFSGGLFDSTHVWLVPYTVNGVLRINVATLSMEMLNSWPAGLALGNGAFVGGVFDSTHVWLVPYRANGALQIHAAASNMTLVPSGGNGYAGGVFDGKRVWLVPYTAAGVALIDTATLQVTTLTLWPSNLVRGSGGFYGGAFDSAHVWLMPYNTNGVVRIDVVTLSMTLLTAWPAGFTPGSFAFIGGVFDSTHLWMLPFGAKQVVRVRTAVACTRRQLIATPSCSGTFTRSSSRSMTMPSLNATTTFASHTATLKRQDETPSATPSARLPTLTATLSRPLLRVSSSPTKATMQQDPTEFPAASPSPNPTAPPLTDTTLGVVVLVLGSTGAAAAGTVSPTSANKPVSASRLLTAAACQQWNVATTSKDDFPTPSAWALLPSVIPKDGSSSSGDAAYRVVSTTALALLVLTVPAARLLMVSEK